MKSKGQISEIFKVESLRCRGAVGMSAGQSRRTRGTQGTQISISETMHTVEHARGYTTISIERWDERPRDASADIKRRPSE